MVVPSVSAGRAEAPALRHRTDFVRRSQAVRAETGQKWKTGFVIAPEPRKNARPCARS
jgi:hypothetical protein